jgi:coenzyme A diphosphatase NUDT7
MVKLLSSAIEGLSSLNRLAIERLSSLPDAPKIPSAVSIKGQAAVAVIVFQAPSSAYGTGSIPPSPTPSDADFEPELHILCTTRALHLSSHPGQASLPGGKVDRADKNVVATTAYRETCEEVGLDSSSMQKGECVLLGVGKPFISKTTLLVHPVIFFLPPATSKKTLSSLYASPDEVSSIWSYPLRSFLSSEPPVQIKKGETYSSSLHQQGKPLTKFSAPTNVDKHRKPQEEFRTYSEVPWLLKGHYRLHRFRTSHQLIKGLTADVLIHMAALAYGPPFPLFPVFSPSQASWDDCVEFIVKRGVNALKTGQSVRGGNRWGDGESGDSYGSMDLYETHVGKDWKEEDLNDVRDRDLLLVKREGQVNWMQLQAAEASSQQQQH